MLLQTTDPESPSVREIGTALLESILSATPRLITGVLFVVIAGIAIAIIRKLVRSTLSRGYPGRQQLVVDLSVTILSLVLWFGVGLVTLQILGMEEVAASLGTATGFIALGVALALREMIADTVAGVYLLQDPDFNEGDVVTTASVHGTVVTIDLRKTRLRTAEGELVVLANSDVEQKWTQLASPGESGEQSPRSDLS